MRPLRCWLLQPITSQRALIRYMMARLVKVTISTGISELVVDGKPVDVYSLDGKLVRSQAKSLNGLKGVYVINGKTVMLK